MLTDQQKEIILSKERHSVVLAGAGSGKTFTIVERVHELLSRGVQPSSIVILTFSRAAARELKQRIGEGKVHIGTFHSFILPFIDPKPNVLSEEESDELVLEAAFATGAAVKKVSGVKNVSGNQNVWRKEAHGRWPTALGKYYASQLALRGDIDYTGILHAGLKLVRDGVICPDYVIVDEAQDNDGLQWDITQAFAERASVMCVGDINQCQPPGTMVTVVKKQYSYASPAETEEIPIEMVKAGDTVLSFSISQRHYYCNGKPVERVGARQYDGDLIKAKTRDGEYRCTTDHICVVKMKDAFFGKHFVYMMRKGDQFRIGKAIGVENGAAKHRFGFMARCTAEGAEAIWLISSHETDMEARMQESILSLTYGIPQLLWKNNCSGRGAKQEHLDEFWSRYKVCPIRAAQLLADHGRDIRYPLWKKGEHTLIARRLTRVRACNLMDGMNFLGNCNPLAKTIMRWLPIEVSRERYSGVVHSLQVADTGTYYANNLLTHNCIHLWRSATPERMENLPWKRYPLTETFRCFSAIVDEANSIDGVTIKLSTKKIGGMVHKSDSVSLHDVISSLSNNNIEDVAVLCPYNVDVQWWKENLEREGVQVAEKWAEVGPVHYLLKWLACPTGSSRKKAAQAMAGCESMHEIIPLLNGSKSDTSVAILAQSWLSSLGVSYGPEEVLRKFSFPMTLWGEAKQISEAYRGETLDSWYANECLSKGMETKSQGLSVSTIHGAKGLEWDMVFMTKTPKDYRLNYVGTTRAKSVLVKGK